MTEIGADDEDAAWISEIWGQQSSIGAFSGWARSADENRYQGREKIRRGEGARKEFKDIRKMHFEAVFILVGRAAHFCKLGGRVERGNQSCVESEGSERGIIVSALGKGTAGQVEVVGGPEKEDSFPWRSSKQMVRMGDIEERREGIYALERSSDL